MLVMPSAYALKKIVLETPLSYSLFDKHTTGLTHTSGKFIFAYLDNTNTRWVLEIISPLGNSESTVYIDVGYTSTAMAISLSTYSSTEVFVSFLYRADGSSGVIWKLYKLNINTYICTQTGTTQTISESMNFRLAISKAIEYEDNYYFVVRQLSFIDVVNCEIILLKYLVATTTCSVAWAKNTGETDNQPEDKPPLWIIQDSFTPEILYLLTVDGNDENRPSYYMMDLTGDSSDCIKIAYHPQTDRIDGYAINKQQFYLGGGKVTYGDYYYLYWTWIRPTLYYESYRKIQVIQHRLIFEDIIHPDNLTAQNERIIQIYPNLLTSPTYNCWAIGGMSQKDLIDVYYPYIESEQYKIMKHQLQVDDWYNYESTDIDSLSYEETLEIPPQDAVMDFVLKEPTSQFQVNCKYTGFEIWIYSGCSAIEKNWDLTLSYIPYESPLVTAKSYYFTATSYLNSLPTKTTLIGYLDGGQIFASPTNSIGQYTFQMIVGTSGSHQLLIKLYFEGDYYYNETYNYLYYSEDEEAPQSSVMLPIITALTVQYVPVFVIMAFSTLSFGKMAGMMGFVIGAIIGIFICASVGLIPTYIIYLMILCVGIGLILILRSG